MIAVPRKLTDVHVVKANLDDYRESNPDKTKREKQIVQAFFCEHDTLNYSNKD